MKAESPALSFYSCLIAGIKRLRRHRFYTSLKGRVRDMKELVRLEGITKAYGDHVIIPPLSLSIHDGEFFNFIRSFRLRKDDSSPYACRAGHSDKRKNHP